LRQELEHHTLTEENVVFPLIRSLENGSSILKTHRNTIRDSILSMETEYDQAGAELAKIRRLAKDFSPPAEACSTFRAMLDGLAVLEADMHRHVHKENSVLFPRAAELVAQLDRA
jgi:regulator of cell morphogenesis and NO signaling